MTIASQTYAVTQAGTSPLNCTASVPEPAQVAIEGRTEVLGDLLLSCTGLSGSLSADISLTLNSNVTNALTGRATDAMLLVNGSNPQAGLISGYNIVDWPAVPLVPGSGGTATVRITGVRADASLLGAQSNLQSVPVTGQVSVSAASPVPVINALQTMAYAGPALLFPKPVYSAPGSVPSFTVQYLEATPAAFQAAAGATPATRLRLVLSNVPAGVTVLAPVFPSEGSGHAQLYSADFSGAGGLPISGVTSSPLPVAGGVASATWVVLAADPVKFDSYTFPLAFQPTNTDVSQIQFAGSIGPVSDVSVASPPSLATVPRYRDFTVLQKLVNLRATPVHRQALATSEMLVSRAKPTSRLSTATVGSNATFTNQVTNDNPDQAAAGVTIRDKVTGGGPIQSCQAPGSDSCTMSGNEATATYGTLAPEQSVNVTVSVQTDPSLPDGTVLQNEISSSSGQPNADLPASGASSGFILIQAATPQLTVGVGHIGNFTQGQNGAAYTISVQNTGTGAGSAGVTVTVTDVLPSGLTPATMSGSGWNCGLPNAVTCTRSDSLAAGSAYPAITLTVNVAPTAAFEVPNQVNLSVGGSVQASTTDTTVILPPYADISSSDLFLPAIDLLREYAITTGCGVSPPLYCGTDNITQAQMAVFVVRSVMGGDNFTYTTTPYFTDEPATDLYFKWVQKMQDLGIALSCGTNQFCPTTPVTRGQMAVLIIRARYGTSVPPNSPTVPAFTDVPATYPYFSWIQKMKQVGITTGCSPTTYCPDTPVTRGQMAVFIMRGEFNQLLPAGAQVIVSASPARGAPGATVVVTLAGQNTTWVSGTTQVSTAPGITVLNVTVTNATTLTVQLAIASNAALGPYSLTATTPSGEEATLPNGFIVQ